MSGAEIARLARALLGPEEEWDEADREFALKLHGVEPQSSLRETCDLVLRVIDRFIKADEEVPSSLVNVLTQLASNLKREDPKVATTIAKVKESLSKKGSKGVAAAARAGKRYRGKTKLTKKDEKILQDLENELLNEQEN